MFFNAFSVLRWKVRHYSRLFRAWEASFFRRFPDSGGAKRDRTADLLHAMQALSQLSYSPVSGNLDGYCWILPPPPPLAQRLQRRQDYIAIFATNATYFIAFTAIPNIIPHPKKNPHGVKTMRV
ncbi:hypothetical protein CBM2618_A160299 [Cupriavidus taiwanensis]|nr:hypothetical protein CBM2618_A160299 [Cupriavidus taiwanensis]